VSGLVGTLRGIGPSEAMAPPQPGQMSRERGRRQNKTALGELGDAVAVGEEAVMADAMESLWKSVQQEAPDELVGA
jgi:hypothetical protein